MKRKTVEKTFEVSDQVKKDLEELEKIKLDHIPRFHLQNQEDIPKSIEFYKKYGFIVCNIFDENNVNPDFISQFLNDHMNNIQSYLHQYQLSDEYLLNSLTTSEQRTKHINALKRGKRFPSKLNLGQINGTLYTGTTCSPSTTNQNQKNPSMDSSSPSPSPSSSNNNHFSSNKNGTFANKNGFPSKETLTDSISQSEAAWLLRSFCFYPYKTFVRYNNIVQEEDQLISSIESSTCIFSKTLHLNNLQGDRLHFFPGIITEKKSTKQLVNNYFKGSSSSETSIHYMNNDHLSMEEKIRYPRGFLSCNDGDSFSLVPGVHNYFSNIIKNMEDNNYSDKRTTTRAVPPPEYQFNPIKIILNRGDFIIYDPRLPKKLSQTSYPANHYGLNVMFFDPKRRNFTDSDHSERRMACDHNITVNDERAFGFVFFSKRRGFDYPLNGTFKRTLLPFLYQHEIKKKEDDPEKQQQYALVNSLISYDIKTEIN